MSIPCLSLNLACRFLSPAVLPAFKGSTLRGAFGHALKSVSCALKKQDCVGCLLAGTCAYAVIFATERTSGGHVAARPHPYILNPPLETRLAYEAGEPFAFNLTLLGPALNFLPHIVYALEEMGRRGVGADSKNGAGRFALSAVRMDHAPDAPPLYDEQDKTLRPPADFPRLALADFAQDGDAATALTIELVTPLRIKKDNMLLQQRPSFADLARAALRRVSSLEKHYGQGPLALDYHGLIQQAEAVAAAHAAIRWEERRRYSNRQRREMLFGGLMGRLAFQGNVAEFLPFFRYCERVNLGKQSAFGLGRIRVRLGDEFGVLGNDENRECQ